MVEANEILLPTFDDDDNPDTLDFGFPSFAAPVFGASSSTTSLDGTLNGRNVDFPTYRSNGSQENLSRPSVTTTPSRPGLPKASSSFSSQNAFQPPSDDRKLGKFSNGSTSSIVTAGTSISSAQAIMPNRKGSFASFKNAFKTGSTNVPPVPVVNSAYPALRNPFSRFDPPASPSLSNYTSPRQQGGARKQSVASGTSISGRSFTSQSSLGHRGSEDQTVTSLPPIPSRLTPSRNGRNGSGGLRYMPNNSSIGALESVGESSMASRTAGQEALSVLWMEFHAAADAKVARICGRPLNTHPSLQAYLEAGADIAFDEQIKSLALAGRRHARRVVDLLHTWCTSQCEGIGASEVRAQLDRSRGLNMRVEEAAVILTGRKSSSAKYILNRALCELVKTTPRDSLGEDLAATLEQNAFNSFRSEKLEESSHTPHQKAVSQMQIELLGALSENRFLSVSNRFARELAHFAAMAQPTRESEAKVEHLLRGVRRLQMRVYPEPELEASAEFLERLAALFANTHGMGLKCAFAETLTSLLHPTIESATAEVNHPSWADSVALILSRAQQLATKPRYWVQAFPLIVVALGVSPRDVFMQTWPTLLDTIIIKLKDKDRSSRITAMNALIRVLWIYLNRCPESSTSTRKRLDAPLRAIFTAPGSLFPSDFPLDPFIAILHVIMSRQTDYCQDFVADFIKGDGLNQPERTAVFVRAVGSTLRTLDEDGPSAFPKSPDFLSLEASATQLSGLHIPAELANRPEFAEILQHCCAPITNLVFACDRTVSLLLLSSDAVSISTHASSSSINGADHATRKNGDVLVHFASRHEQALYLFSAVLDLLPGCLASDVDFSHLANVLCRATFSADPAVCKAASEAMRRCAKDDPTRGVILVTTYQQFIFETRHVFRDTFMGVRMFESQFERVISLWVDLLGTPVAQRRLDLQSSERSAQDPSVLEKLEACGVFLLCSTSAGIRQLAIQVLSCVRDLHGGQSAPSAPFRYSRINPDQTRQSRVIQIIEKDWSESDMKAIRSLPWLTSNDRHRLDAESAESKTKLLRRIIESSQTKDASLWLALLPFFIAKLGEQLPETTQHLRAIVFAIVLRLQGHVAAIGSVSAGRATPGMRSHPTAGKTSADITSLADHWRSYMSVLCVTLSHSTGQPATPSVHRTKEAIILTPDTIGTPALFQYLTSLCSWDDPRFKDAAVYALGSIGSTLLGTLSEVLVSGLRRLADGSKTAMNARDTTRRMTPNGNLWTSLSHVFRLISPLIMDPKSSSHLSNLSSTITFVKLTLTFLSDRTVKEDYELQSLRRSFCIVVENLTNALGRLDASDRFLGEETRGAIFKLCYEWCHLGRRPDVAKARESHTLQLAAEGYRGERDRAQYLDDLQAKTKLLSAAAADAMAGLCQGRLISTSTETTPAAQASEHIVEPFTVLRWIRGMFSSSTIAHHDTARKALFSLIKYNWECTRMLDEVLHQSFGEGEQFALESSFFGVVADILGDGIVQLPTHQTVCLCLSKLAHPVSDVRQRAFQLCVFLVPENGHDRLRMAKILPLVGNFAPNQYRSAQTQVSQILADVYGDQAFSFLAECTARLSQLEAPRRHATISILLPWMARLDLSHDRASLSAEDAAIEHQALANLVYIAIRFMDDHSDEIQDILLAFADASDTKNGIVLTRFLFEEGGKRKSAEFMTHAQRIMSCLALSEAADSIFDEVCALIEPSAMAAVAEIEPVTRPVSSQINLDALLNSSSNKPQTFSTGQMALLFAAQLLPNCSPEPELNKHLLTFLHISLMHCDHPATEVRQQCQDVLFQVLSTWIQDTSLLQPSEAASKWVSAQAKVTSMVRARSSIFWKVDDIGDAESAFVAPIKLTAIVLRIMGILLPFQPRFRQNWSELAMTWATSCPIRQLACRSFQVFRILSPRVNQKMIADSLARLSSTISSGSPEIQSFNLEVLRTFSAMAQNVTMTEMSNFPQLFWCAVACLTTPSEKEFAEVIDLLSHILDKTNLSAANVSQQLLAARPVEWRGSAPHLQSLLLVGLRSSKTDMLAFDLIRRLASVHSNALIDSDDDRLIHGFVAALPWMLLSLETGEPNEDLAAMAIDLATIAEQADQSSLSRLLTSFANVRFRSKDDFIRQACSILRDSMATHALTIIQTLLGFVLNSNDWMKEKSMAVLKLLFQSPEARAPLNTHLELLTPLLRLMSTKHAAQALDVLDIPMSHPTDESDSGEIFGAIEPSGWSVPNHKEAAAVTRENVSAVFNTCAKETRAASAHFSVVQFTDLLPFENPSQTSLELEMPSPPMSSEGPDNSSMGDLVGALHSLNQFFDDGSALSPPKARVKKSGHGRLPSDSFSERRIRAVIARGMNHSISSPIAEHPSESPFPLSGHHKHTTSDLTASSVSSGRSEVEDMTRRPLQPTTNGNMPQGWHRRQESGSGSLSLRRLAHQNNPSYSSTATDVDGFDEMDKTEASLWGLEDTVNMSSTGLTQTTTSDGTDSGTNTPINVRGAGVA